MERLPCSNPEDCPLAETDRGCFEDIHHLAYPRYDYKTSVEKRYRDLPENKLRMCRNLHNIEHEVFEAPTKPDREIMLLAITEERNRRLNGLA